MESFRYQLEDINSDGHTEEERLNLQAEISAYSIESEFLKLGLVDRKGILLDAGCGTGNAISWLSSRNTELSIHGCDISDINLSKSKKLCPQAHLFQSNLDDININDSTYDYVLNRYVYEYLQTPQLVANEFYRVLKPGGEVNVIAVDGLMTNFHSSNTFFNSEIEDVFKKIEIDLNSGRKVQSYLHTSGFKKIDVKLESHLLNGKDLDIEIENIVIRFSKAKSTFLKIMSDHEYLSFTGQYIEELRKEQSTYFFNKFLIKGVK